MDGFSRMVNEMNENKTLAATQAGSRIPSGTIP
jgi:hypothetical protein